MRIALITATDVFPLAGESGVAERDFSSAVDFRLAARINRQSGALLRAATAAEIDRQNLATTVSFGTRRVFATALDAFAFALGYDATTERAGTLRIATVSPSGTVASRELQEAVVAPPRRRVEGCTVHLTYTVTGGGIVTGTAGTTRVLDEAGGVELDENGGAALTEE